MKTQQLLSLLAVAAAQQQMVASPPSTLLPPGTTALPLALATDEATNCRWDVADVPYASMKHDFAGAGGTAHTTTLDGLSGGLVASVFYVSCAAYAAGPPLVLAYRELPDSASAPFPRLGNLWGSGNFRGHPEGLAYAARRASLWLGSDWTAAEISQLRAANPFTVALTSINACEVNDQDLPDEFYLTNITQPPSTRGRLQSWPGAWRLDLTNEDVQAWQADLMCCLVVYGGSGYGSKPGCNNATIPPLIYDGLFVDNVFMDDGAAVNSKDIFHNPFIPLDRATGKPMLNFGARWKAGMVAMLARFRDKMPSALLDGHAMDIADGNISAQFNAISIGFTTPQVIEGLTSFASGAAVYEAWMTVPAREPKITMIESAVRLQLGYGYGFDRDLQTLIPAKCVNSNSVPGTPVPGIGDACDPPAPLKPGYLLPQTYLTARSEYQYMRFGHGFTLMRDGYYTHELGDSWHGMDWTYDELLFSLGAALGNSSAANVTNWTPPPVPAPIPLTQPWSLWVRDPIAANASWAMDASMRPPVAGAPPSVRVDIAGTAAARDGIDLSLTVTSFQRGGYLLSFWARASRDGTLAQLNARKDGGDWHNVGLDVAVTLSTAWQQHNATFTCTSDGSAARLSWFLGSAAPNTSVWINSPTLTGFTMPPPVSQREFECGVVVLNGDTVVRTVALADSLSRLSGQQAPLWQYIVDDNSTAFQATVGDWKVKDYDSGYDRATPSQEQVRPASGYFHHWGVGAPAGSAAVFDLRVPAVGTYNVSLWWPAAVPARSSWSTAMRVSVGGAPQATVNLSRQGGDVFFLVAAGVQLDPASTLEVSCPAGSGDCIADAVRVESAARWNDGSSVGGTVTLPALDAIVLKKTAGAPPHCAQRP